MTLYISDQLFKRTYMHTTHTDSQWTCSRGEDVEATLSRQVVEEEGNLNTAEGVSLETRQHNQEGSKTK